MFWQWKGKTIAVCWRVYEVSDSEDRKRSLLKALMGKVGSSNVTFLEVFVSKPADTLSLLTAFKQFLLASVSPLAVALCEEEKFTSNASKRREDTEQSKTIIPTGSWRAKWGVRNTLDCQGLSPALWVGKATSSFCLHQSSKTHSSNKNCRGKWE